MYKVGDIIIIISMQNEPQYNGKAGVIDFIDDIGQLHGTWGGCALIPDIDEFVKVEGLSEELNNPVYIEQIRNYVLSAFGLKGVKECCICGGFYVGHGNNAEPVKSGLCCDECNKLVVMARLGGLNNEQKNHF